MYVRLSGRFGASALAIVFVIGAFTPATAAGGLPSEWLGPKPPGTAYPEGEEDRQFAILSHDLRQRARFKQFAPQTLREESLIVDGDRDPLDVVLRRSEALLADLTRMTKGTHATKGADLAGMAESLAALRAAAERTDVKDPGGRRAVFDKVCRLRRKIALANPLLDFGEILILKRHLAIYRHMCDQYYGMAQRPGGGLFVLSDPFGSNPGIRDLLADSTVANGRLKGQRLSGGPKRAWNISFDGMGNQHGEVTEGGSFLSPDVSFDGRKIAFAYVECRGNRTHRHHTDPTRGHWDPGRCYHVFTVSADGSDLRMLTDGTFNDFDPCFMPSGRIALISERRGGYLRCGRVCPTFTLYDMAVDGSDVRCLSYHETNEWHPSVAHDGMIVWTRWDYIDRHGQTVHLPWLTTPDGRDPRAVHGNFAIRSKRPDMEVDIRAIPESRRFVATAAPHHDQAFGSLVVFDPTAEDDDAMGPVKRVTPDVGFPESQGGSLSYGQAWPLSEDYYLCVYAPQEVGAIQSRSVFGIYLVDAFGNKELIYRDGDIACHNPIPLVPRPVPPVLPEQSRRVAADEPAEATVAVLNVYGTLKPWPKGARIKALRVYQVLPLSIASAKVSHATGMQIPQA
ncbi:MAG: TolB family protein, partial [Planctomycetota bacterium]